MTYLLTLNKYQKPEKQITSIAIPALGCENDGLDWLRVKETICQYLEPLDIAIEVYEPNR